MNLLDLYEGREPYQQAIDKLEQRRIEDLEAKMDDFARRGMKDEFLKCKEERDSYYAVKEGNVITTPTGLKHQAKPGTYGGYEPEADPLARLDKHAVNRAEKAMGVKFDREKKFQGGLDLDEDGDRVDPILIKALNNMPDNLKTHGEVLDACYDAYAMELGKMRMKSEYGTTRVYVPKLMDLYKQKHGLTFNEASIGQDLVTPQQRVQQSQPQKQTPVGKAVDTAKQAAKWVAGQGGPGKEGPTYEGQGGDVTWKEQERVTRLERLRALAKRQGDHEKFAKLDAEIKHIYSTPTTEDQTQKKKLDLHKGVIPTEPLPEHGGGVPGGKGWQSMKPTKRSWQSMNEKATHDRDVQGTQLIRKARSLYPVAGSDEEALALYVADIEQQDVAQLKAKDREQLQTLKKLNSINVDQDKEIDSIESEIDNLTQTLTAKLSKMGKTAPKAAPAAAPAAPVQPTATPEPSTIVVPQEPAKAKQAKPAAPVKKSKQTKINYRPAPKTYSKAEYDAMKAKNLPGKKWTELGGPGPTTIMPKELKRVLPTNDRTIDMDEANDPSGQIAIHNQGLEMPVASKYVGDGQFKITVKNKPYIATIAGWEINPSNPGILDSFYLTDVATGKTEHITSGVNDPRAVAIYNNLENNQKPALRDIYKQDMAFYDEHGWNTGHHPERLQGLKKTGYKSIPADRFIKGHQDMKKVTGQDVDEGYQDFNKVEPYAVCLAGKPVKKFDYYEDARRFHDNWKKKLYREGDKAKADKITLMPLNLDEDDPMGGATIAIGQTAGAPADIPPTYEAANPAQQAAIAIAMKKANKKPKQVDEAKGEYKVYYMTAEDHKLMGRYASREEAEQRLNQLQAEYPDNKFIIWTNNKQGVAEGNPNSDPWYVYARQNPKNFKKFKTYDAAKAYADKHGLTCASAGHFHDKVKEGIVASGPSKPLDDRAVRKMVWDTMKINADTGEQALQRALAVLAKKPQSRMVQDLQDKFQNLSDRLAQGLVETTDVKSGMAKIYNKLAPKIERHRDSFLAGQLYDELENYAELHGAEDEFKRMMNGARNRAHMEYDTNPGGFQNWFWFLPFGDEQLDEFAPSPERDDDEVPNQIFTLANRWWNAAGDQPKITNVLRSLGWSIAQVESEDDAVQLMHNDGTTYFISADDFDPDVFEAQTDYQKRRQRERDVDAGKPVRALPRNPQTDYARKRAKEKRDLEQFGEEKTRLDPKCWTGKKIGNPKTKVKGGVRVNNCVPAEESYMESVKQSGVTDSKLLEAARRIDAFAKNLK